MSFCLGMKVAGGLIGIADSRVTSGTEHSTARKVSIHQNGRHSMFVMTSGLRSVRDKALTYFEEVIQESDREFDKLYKAVNAFAEQIRRAAKEDKHALEESGLPFNLHALVGGQLENDAEHKLYLLYPQANWVEIGAGTPYYIIGETGYGKPLLDRALRYETPMELALKIGYLAFDATRTSATDVDFPLDIVVYRRDTFALVEHCYEREALISTSDWWQEQLRLLVDQAPAKWIDEVFSRTPGRSARPGTYPPAP
ncbi:MAG: peptidase [Candidatus Latescibacteria bacterium]|nr:peptidase [Candidatus Latescibacterota bacterium]